MIVCRPLKNVPAVILCPGPDFAPDVAQRFIDDGYFTIGVNAIWRKLRNSTPTVAFWIDGDIPRGAPETYQNCLSVCDASAAVAGTDIALPAARMSWRSWPVYTELDSAKIYMKPSTGVSAALWAISLGCWPVVGLGMGCEEDGRDPRQLSAMRECLGDLLIADYRPEKDHRPAFWLWDRAAIENDVVMASRWECPRLRNCGPGPEAIKILLRQFYGD